jgi:hypothetical protein
VQIGAKGIENLHETMGFFKKKLSKDTDPKAPSSLLGSWLNKLESLERTTYEI